MSLVVVDKNAKTFVQNTGEFRMPHPTREDKHIFEPGEIYKIDLGSWIDGQTVLKQVPNPFASDDEQAAETARIKQEEEDKELERMAAEQEEQERLIAEAKTKK